MSSGDQVPGLEHSLRQFFERNRTVQLLIDPQDGRVVAANPAACAFYGYSHEQLTSLRISQINTLPEPLVRAALQRALGEWGQALHFTHRLASGELRPVEVHTGPLEVEGRTLLHSLIFDVSGRHSAEQAARQSEEKYRAILDSIEDGYYEADLRGAFTFCNDALCRLLGLTPQETLGRSYRSYTTARAARRMYRDFRRVFSSEQPQQNAEWEVCRKDGQRLTVAASLSPMRDTNGRPIGFRGIVRDVSEQKRHQRLQAALYRIATTAASALNMAELYAQLHAIVGELMYARNFYIALYDVPTQTLSFPYHVDELDAPPSPQPLGRGLTEYVLRSAKPLLADPRTFQDLVDAGEVEAVGANSLDWLGVPLLSGTSAFGVLVVQSYSAQRRFTAAERELLTFVSQHVSSAIERQRAQGALRESESRFRSLAQTAPCAIVIYRDEGFLYANDAALAVTGRTREELQRTRFWELVTPDLREALRERELERLRQARTEPDRYELRVLRPDGSARWLDYSVGLIHYDGAPAILATAFDVSERKRAEEQVRHLAYHDALTGLPNRLLFHDRLEVAVAQAHRDRRSVGVLFLDLDRFKAINDSMGHSQGDRLLQDVARRLERSVREGDTVARLSGDEFTLILPGLAQGLDAAKAAEKVLEVLRQPFELKGREVFVTSSLGISLYPDDGTDAETLTKNADTAMYRAKEEGRDGYQLYAPNMNARALERLALENALRRAFLQQELTLAYQPLVDAKSGRVLAVEALLRWEHEGRQVPPAEFIPVAEVTGLIVPMGRSVLRKACAQTRLWHEHGHRGLRVAVNLSAREFQQPDLARQVREALAESGLPPECLDLEVTETSAMQNSVLATQALGQLKALGVRLSIDDFGIGYSSLAYLKLLPFDTLKIDQSFVRDIPSDPDDAAIVSAMIEVAHALGRQVVAEGVESEAQRAFLADHGCDGMQGYLFSRPLRPEQLEAFLEGLRLAERAGLG